eukprot:SAG31_NODE_1081_length_10014_cov_16.919617_5_plen_100_part_00
MVILTGDALYGIVMTLVSTLALLVLMALAVGVLRAGMKNILPFLAVAGSGALLGAQSDSTQPLPCARKPLAQQFDTVLSTSSANLLRALQFLSQPQLRP